MCNDKVHARTCYFYTNVEKKKEDPVFHSGIMDIEDLVKAGKKQAVCPYFLSRELQKTADVTFAPYNYLVDLRRSAKLGIELQNTVVIIDEAHNVEKICEDVASQEIKLSEIVVGIAEIDQVIDDFQKYEEALMLDSNLNQTHGAGGPANISKEDLAVLKTYFLNFEKALSNIETKKDGVTFNGPEVFRILGDAGITPNNWNILQKFCEDLVMFLSSGTGRNLFRRHGVGLRSFVEFLDVVYNKQSQGVELQELVGRCYKVNIVRNKG
jgi:regulator of telomere elongation helicase 1